jgi:hypothetical protein
MGKLRQTGKSGTAKWGLPPSVMIWDGRRQTGKSRTGKWKDLFASSIFDLFLLPSYRMKR